VDKLSDIPAEEHYKIASVLVEACNRFELAAPQELIKIASQRRKPVVEEVTTSPIDELNMTITHFMDKTAEYEPKHRRELCVEIMKQAEALELEGVPVEVAIYASDTRSDDFKDHLEVRRGLLKKAGMSEYIPLLDELETSCLSIDEVAEVISEIDKTAGLERLYDVRIADPYAAVCGYPAQEVDTSYIQNDIVKYAQSDDAKEMFSEEFLNMVASDPCILDTIPDALQNVFAEGLDQFNVKG